MSSHIPTIELPEFATLRDRLAGNIEFAREAASVRVGYDVEVASLEPIEAMATLTCAFTGAANSWVHRYDRSHQVLRA